jgi:hypothetical protein
MAKKLLLDALVKVLGDFIELNEENLDLNLAVWNGKIALHDMKLKSLKILRSYNISIQYGSIQNLEITIPWTALLNSPVQVVIDGVYLQVGPLNMADLDKKETKDRAMNLKLEKLLLADKFLGFDHHFDGSNTTSDNSSEDSGSASYVQQWTARIVDNIEIEIRNVHIRYEDSTTIPGTTFAAGLTLDSFGISTCDDNWKEIFVSRNPKDTKSTIRKLARLQRLGIYWSLKTEPLAHKSYREWISEMKSRIYTSAESLRLANLNRSISTGGYGDGKSFDAPYILKPENKLLVKLTHNEGHNEPHVPTYDISVECSKLEIAADKSQFQQIIKTTDMLNAVERLRQPYSYRPIQRPHNPATCRAWWKYAYRLALCRPVYVKLVKLSKQRNATTGWEENKCTPTQQLVMRSIEEKLPVTNLILFRHIALRELAAEYRQIDLEAKRKERREQAEAAANQSWWSYYAGKAADVLTGQGDEDNADGDNLSKDDVSLSELMTMMNKQASTSKAADHQKDHDLSNKLLYRFRLSASAALELFRYSHPVAKATMTLAAECSIALTSMSASCALSDTVMIDCCSVDPIIKDIITVRTDTLSTEIASSNSRAVDNGGKDAHLPTISVSYINCNNKTTVRVSALPIEIALNKECIQQLVSMFMLPPRRTAAEKTPALPSSSSTLKSRGRSTTKFGAVGAVGAALFLDSARLKDSPKADGQAVSPTAANNDSKAPSSSSSSISDSKQADETVDGGTMEITFEAHAPKIIIPEDPTNDSGYLFLDAGYLVVKGNMDVAGMHWKCSLSNIHAGMPLEVKDIYKLNRDDTNYLIKPFDINISVQNKDKSVADQTIDVKFSPEVRGELDKAKLARLLFTLSLLSAMSSGCPPSPLAKSPSAAVLGRLDSPRAMDPTIMKAYSVARVPSTEGGMVRAAPSTPMTPLRAVSNNGTVDDAEIMELLDSLSPESVFDELNSPDKAEGIDDITLQDMDPRKVNTVISVLIPTIALDLMYDAQAKNHLIFATDNLAMQLVSRPFDSQIVFELGSLSIKDSMRAKEQCDLAYSPLEGDNRLVRIKYTTIQRKLSPYYQGYATEIDAKFAKLQFNTDVNTVSHLKPFFSVLLGRSSDPASKSGDDKPGNGATSLKSADGIAAPAPASPSKAGPYPASPGRSTEVTGMLVRFYMEHMSLELLRAAEKSQGSEKLRSAFLLQLTGLGGNIDMANLMKADVSIRSIEIIDTREVSRTYAFQKIFCPVADLETATPAKYAQNEVSSPQKKSSEGGVTSPLVYSTPQKSKQRDRRLSVSMDHSSPDDLLTVTYSQETKDISFVGINVKNMTTFVALDTILDLAEVAAANAFAFLNLLQNDAPANVPSAGGSGSITTRKSAVHSVSPTNRSDTESVNSDNGSRRSPKVKSFSTMTVSVTMENPRIVLLDEPSLEASRAIVCRGFIEVILTRDNRLLTDDTIELQQSLHTTIKELEVFVILSMQHWHPLPILEPFGMDFHMKTHQLAGNMISSSISLDIDDIKARVSMNDVMLAQSILMRKSLSNATVPTNNSDGTKKEDSAKQNTSNDEEQPRPMTSMTICFGTLTFIAINDYGGKNVPVVRLQIEDAKYVTESQLESQHATGEASFGLSADFYNADLSVWEPIIELWRPTFNSLASGSSSHFEINSDGDLQFTVTSTFLETLLQSYTQLLACEDVTEREKVPDVTINNLLGVPCDITDSSTGELLAAMEGYQSVILPTRYDPTRSFGINRNTFAYLEANKHRFGMVDLVVTDSFGSRRQSVRRLPFNVNKAKVYNVFPKEIPMQPLSSTFVQVLPPADPSTLSSPVKIKKAQAQSATDTKLLLMDPVIEEVYEFSRYDPLLQQWRAPFLMNDPYEWADATGLVRKNIREISIDERVWIWQDAWSVDMDGEVGEEIDSDGWSYNGSVTSFTQTNCDRIMRPMDTIRRRRWVRAKVPVLPPAMECLKPLVVVWDVQSSKNGSVKVDIRSDFRIVNSMPFAISISLSNTTWSEDEELRPIKPDETFSVPLAFSAASAFSIRPHFDYYKDDVQLGDRPLSKYQWSQSILCKRQTHNFATTKNVICSCADSAPVCMQVGLKQKDGMLSLRVDPFFIVLNALPCSLGVRILSGYSNEACDLMSGEITKLKCMNFNNEILICVKVGSYEWSAPCKLNLETKETCLFDLFDRNNELSLVVSMNIVSVNKQIQLEFYSHSVIFDRTGLGLAVLGLRESKGVLRRTVDMNTTNYLNAAFRDKNQRNNEAGETNGYSSTQALTRPEDKNRARLLQQKHARKSAVSSHFAGHHQTPAKKGKTQVVVTNTTNTLEGLEMFNIATIQNFKAASEREYQVTVSDLGGAVYTDSNLIWTYLPESMIRCTYISTPSADHNVVGRKHIQFDLDSSPALVMVCVDSQLEHKWLVDAGYVRLTQQAIAINVKDGKEFSYAIFGKLCDAFQHITIPGNWSKNASFMYVCFIVSVAASNERVARYFDPVTADKVSKSASKDTISMTYGEWEHDRIIEQVSFHRLYRNQEAESSWIEGKNGISMFYAENDIIALGIYNNNGGGNGDQESEATWSDDLSINTSTSAVSSSVEVMDWSSMIAYQLSYSLSFMPGVFHRTQQLTVFPTYVIVNCCQEMLFVRQVNTDVDLAIKPFNSESWHKTSAMQEPKVHIRCESSQWSLGTITTHQIGSYVLLLPANPSSGSVAQSATMVSLSRKPGNPVFLNVEVKVAEPGENASIVIVVWESSYASDGKYSSNLPLGIRNESDVPVCIRQSLTDLESYAVLHSSSSSSSSSTATYGYVDHESPFEMLKRYAVCVNPGESIPYGWADPEALNEVIVVVGVDIYETKQRKATINMVHAGEAMRFPDNSGRSGAAGEIILEVVAEHGGRILKISRAKSGLIEDQAYRDSEIVVPTASATGISVFISSLSVSLTLDKPTRREVLNLSVIGLEVQAKLKADSRSIEFMIEDMQIDNFMETAVHPVLLCRFGNLCIMGIYWCA